MANQMVVVFSFEEPDDPVTMGMTIEILKEHFQELEAVKVHLGKGRAAAYIMEFFQTGLETRSPLVEHAKRELALIDPNEPDDGFKESIVKAVQGFVSYGHSGGSAVVAIGMINDLLQGKNLTPLTSAAKEWMDVGPQVWQSTRCSEAFSEDMGKTYYLLSDEPRVIYTSEDPPDESKD